MEVRIKLAGKYQNVGPKTKASAAFSGEIKLLKSNMIQKTKSIARNIFPKRTGSFFILKCDGNNSWLATRV